MIFFDLEPIAYGEKTILDGLVLGAAASLPWGVRTAFDPHPVHPVQLYEAAADLLLVAAIALWTLRRDRETSVVGTVAPRPAPVGDRRAITAALLLGTGPP